MSFPQYAALQEAFLKQRSVSTDTRNIKPGDIFFALKGPNFNANAFALQALAAGASFAVIDEPQYAVPGDARYIVVEDVLLSLQGLANWFRQKFSIPFIGLTGSNGKTTTKELMHAVLSTEKRTHATRGNLNNHIGVPLTLLSLPDDAEIAIIEMGANKPGDIAELCAIAEPTHTLITNVGLAHIEGMGGQDGIERTKGEIFAFTRAHGGSVWVNATDARVVRQSEGITNRVFFGNAGDDYHLQEKKLHAESLEVIVTGKKVKQPLHITSHLIGEHNAANVLAAAVCGFECGIQPAHIAEGIAAYIPAMNRTQIVKAKNFTILLDAYNANPSSMKAAIETLARQNYGRVALVLGDMFELGTAAEEMHRELGRQVAGSVASRVIGVGPLMKYALEECSGVSQKWYETTAEAKAHIAADLEGAEFVLIKGSRGMGLEKLLPELE